jgi:hypothetical protein
VPAAGTGVGPAAGWAVVAAAVGLAEAGPRMWPLALPEQPARPMTPRVSAIAAVCSASGLGRSVSLERYYTGTALVLIPGTSLRRTVYSVPPVSRGIDTQSNVGKCPRASQGHRGQSPPKQPGILPFPGPRHHEDL